MAKLESVITVTVDRLDIRLFGFNEKLPVLATKIAELINSLVPREDRFQVFISPSLHCHVERKHYLPVKILHSLVVIFLSSVYSFWAFV